MRRALRKALGGVTQYRLQFTIPSTRRPRRLAPWILRMCVFYIINKPDYPHSLQFTQSNSNGNLDFTSLRIGQIRRLNCKFVRSWIVFWTALSVPTHLLYTRTWKFLEQCLWALSWWHRHETKQGTLSLSEETLRGCRRRLKTGAFFFAVTIAAGGPSPIASFLELNLDSLHSLAAHWSTMYTRQTH
jgi:hypothetical protein